MDPWPLNVPPRTLSVLAQVLLLRLQPSSGGGGATSGLQPPSRSTPPPPGAPTAGATLLDPMATTDAMTSLGAAGATAATSPSASMVLKSSAGQNMAGADRPTD